MFNDEINKILDIVVSNYKNGDDIDSVIRESMLGLSINDEFDDIIFNEVKERFSKM
jgi:hypothetical protein